MSSLHTSVGEYLSMRRALGFKLDREEHAATPIRGLHLCSRRAARDRRRRIGVGDVAAAQPDVVVKPTADRSRPCRPHARDRPGQRGSRTRSVANPAASRHPIVYSQRQIDTLIAAARTLRTPHRVATMQTLLGLLAVTGMRIGEVIRTRRGRLRLPQRLSARAWSEVRKVTGAGAAPQHRDSRAALPATSRPPITIGRHRGAAAHDGRHSPEHQGRSAHLHHAQASRRDRSPLAFMPSPRSRHPPQLCCRDCSRRLPRRRGRRAQARSARHLPRSRQSRLDLLVSVGRPGAHATRRGPLRAPYRSIVMTTLAPTLQAFFTERLTNPKARQPAHDRRLPRHDPAASSVRRRTYRHATERPRYRRPRRAANRRVPRSPRARAWQRRAHPQRPPCGYQSPVSLRRAPTTPSTPQRSSRSCRSHPSASSVHWSASSPRPSSTRCWAPQTERLDRWTQRPRPDPARRPDRAARLRADRAHLRRPSSRTRPPRQLRGQTTQATHHTTDREHGQDPVREWLREREGLPDEPLFPTRAGAPLSRDHSSTASPSTPPPPLSNARSFRPSG